MKGILWLLSLVLVGFITSYLTTKSQLKKELTYRKINKYEELFGLIEIISSNFNNFQQELSVIINKNNKLGRLAPSNFWINPSNFLVKENASTYTKFNIIMTIYFPENYKKIIKILDTCPKIISDFQDELDSLITSNPQGVNSNILNPIANNYSKQMGSFHKDIRKYLDILVQEEIRKTEKTYIESIFDKIRNLKKLYLS